MTERHARVIAASNRAAEGTYEDRTGPIIVAWLRERGFRVADAEVVPDGTPVRAALERAVEAEVELVLTTGGTGISPTDRTPEMTAELLDFSIPGLAEALRTAGLPEVPTAVLSRGLAGVAGGTLVVNLPGSRGGVRDGLGVLDGVLEHALDQVRGGDHRRATSPAPEVATPESTASAAAGEASDTGNCATAVVSRAAMTEETVDVAQLERAVQHSSAGAVVTFAGAVRDHDGGRGVRELEYTSHPSAAEVIREVAADVASRSEGVHALAVEHRTGVLRIGDVALGCAVAAEHRKQGFDACSELVDEVKRRLPVWKRQVFEGGQEEWVNCP
ncbi:MULTISPECIES: molybdenum cofactor biosynthesis protein MoaE [Actinopolyspora]|uniref:Molybdenum cofactor synthesis domain-containing protein n=1 Tax=Actinopolyspora saharensis TaxID=995062 RepID=A0A1H1EVD0_9ACTN|nr:MULTISPECIES: molybdenum cofactor biosynthesis protein MoaE [Actinopolyspora]NHD18244.1 molybdenum cofactor biosynthesis protein MoaB [Actinopolyspora sp. BKK2]NHE77077.1 molybdenum cofactor biosynthesis protein MoaB [Actinopolyspora sp. BKK1]SDQ92692.1 molybdenum cofactor synthesis domain-containing protein [Actinopolyspora saharensis]